MSPFFRSIKGNILNKYEIILYWSADDNAFIAEVPELPGWAADGQTYLDQKRLSPNYGSHYRWGFYYGEEWGIVQPEVAWVMVQKIEFIETAFRHEYTEEDIRHGINTQIKDTLLAGYEDTYGLVGFDRIRRPIEIAD
ncbi:hypothetical protein FACS1894137_18040 [Spirochaetia bacterium]|nr:hypothetical protein FACS1894137_18040 [Spirochaetia bacterium]